MKNAAMVICIAVIGCSRNDEIEDRFIASSSSLRKQNILSIPNDHWVPIYFGAIDARAKQYKLRPLREKHVGDKGLEVRIWSGFGFTTLEGIILSREGNTWDGKYIGPLHGPGETQSLDAPNSGWTVLWESAVALDLLTLPDESELKSEIAVLDGISYVVEILQENRYRTYMYCNPSYQNWPEAEKIISIIRLMNQEFNLNELRKAQIKEHWGSAHR